MILLLAETDEVLTLTPWPDSLTVSVFAGFCGRLAPIDVTPLRLHPAAVSLCLAAMASPALRGSQDYPDPLCFGFVALSVSVWPQ